jgi:hypothetical protein
MPRMKNPTWPSCIEILTSNYVSASLFLYRDEWIGPCCQFGCSPPATVTITCRISGLMAGRVYQAAQ